jgi:hypothetical protein
MGARLLGPQTLSPQGLARQWVACHTSLLHPHEAATSDIIAQREIGAHQLGQQRAIAADR